MSATRTRVAAVSPVRYTVGAPMTDRARTPIPTPTDAERARRRAFLALPMSERLRRGVEFSRFALRNLGAARQDRP